MTVWLGGLQVRGLDQGETPVADFLCSHCLEHRRVTGRNRVAAFAASIRTDHRATCPGLHHEIPGQRTPQRHANAVSRSQTEGRTSGTLTTHQEGIPAA